MSTLHNKCMRIILDFNEDLVVYAAKMLGFTFDDLKLKYYIIREKSEFVYDNEKLANFHYRRYQKFLYGKINRFYYRNLPKESSFRYPLYRKEKNTSPKACFIGRAKKNNNAN